MLTHKKTIFAVACALLLAWMNLSGISDGLGVLDAYAQGVLPNPVETGLQKLMGTLSIMLSFMVFLAYLVLFIVGVLLDTETIFAINEITAIGRTSGNGVLQDIWILTRNITNIIFAFMLVFAALYTVVTANRDLVKERIGKFVIAVILVNFSWFFPRVVLDVANVLTASVYSIPSAIDTGCVTRDEDGNENSTCRYVANVILFPDSPKHPPADVPPDCLPPPPGAPPPANPDVIRVSDQVCIELRDLPEAANTSLGVINGLFVNHGRFLHINKLQDVGTNAGLGTVNSFDQIKKFISFLIQLLFLVFYGIAIMFPLIAMGVVFFIRMIVLWLTIAFMPFMFIGFVMGDKMGKANTMELIWGHFWRAAFLPTVTAIPLAVGFIMLNAGNAVDCTQPAVQAVLSEGAKKVCSSKAPIIPGTKHLYHLLWDFVAIFVLWTGFFTALSIDEIYEKVGSSFKSYGESVGKFALKAPLAAAVVPLPGTPGVSLLQAGRALRRPESTFIDAKGHLNTDIAKALSGGGNAPAGGADRSRAIQSIKNNTQTTANLRNNISVINQGGPNAVTELEKARQTLRSNGLGDITQGTVDQAAQAMRDLGLINGAASQNFVQAFETLKQREAASNP